MKEEHPQVQRVVLETSLKPFAQIDPDNIEQTCHRILSQWHPLLDISAECSILFWVADGSEILTTSPMPPIPRNTPGFQPPVEPYSDAPSTMAATFAAPSRP